MRNLYNEEVVTASDIAQVLLREIDKCPGLKLKGKSSDCPMAFSIEMPADNLLNTYNNFNIESLNRKAGVYCIYKENKPIYLGASDTSIGNRISRFVKEVWGKSRHDESHPAAKKYRNYFGRGNFESLTVRYVEYKKPNNINLVSKRRGDDSIETNLVRVIKPLLNS